MGLITQVYIYIYSMCVYIYIYIRVTRATGLPVSNSEMDPADHLVDLTDHLADPADLADHRGQSQDLADTADLALGCLMLVELPNRV